MPSQGTVLRDNFAIYFTIFPPFIPYPFKLYSNLMTMASFTVRNVQYAVLNLGLTGDVILANGCPKDPNPVEPDPVLRRLKAVLTHPIGDYAVQPREATWAAHGITQAHYLKGASYTVGATQVSHFSYKVVYCHNYF